MQWQKQSENPLILEDGTHYLIKYKRKYYDRLNMIYSSFAWVDTGLLIVNDDEDGEDGIYRVPLNDIREWLKIDWGE